MRRHRPFPIYWSAILTVVVGVAAVPATAIAEGDDVAPAERTAPPADQAPAASTPPASSQPAAPPTTEPDPADSGDTPPPSSTPAPGGAVDSPESPEELAPPTTSPAADPAPSTPPAAPRVASEDATSDAATSVPYETPGNDELDAAFAALPDGVVRPIAFPVLGPVRYANGWGNCRDGCARRHLGTDLMGVAMQPLLAAVDGTVTRIRYANEGTAGAAITITGADGWYYNYFHVNDDSPGTHDGAAGPEWQVSPQLTVGSPVRVGQVIGYMGDSGNAQGAPHLHFEIRQPDRTPVNPYPSLAAAEQSPTCGDTATWLDPTAVSPKAVAIIPLDDGGRWLIDRDGHLYAEGSAAAVHAASGVDCTPAEPIAGAADVPAAAPDEAVPPVAAPQPVAPPPPPQPLAEPTPEPQPVAEPAPEPQPVVEPAPEPQPVVEPAPESPAATTWTVSRGQSLWEIVQEAYGVSDVASTVSLVDQVFDHNRSQLTDPNLLNVGTELLLPAI